jgi:tetratricopeptide (TPR) repeat protein
MSAESPQVQPLAAGDVYALPTTANGPQARTRAELDAFGRVMESKAPAEIIARAEAFASQYPQSQMLPMVRLREMRGEMAANSYAGATAVGHELLSENPRDLEALLMMASILPDFPPQEASRRTSILAEARQDIEAAEQILETFHRPQGTSAEEFLMNKRRLAASLAEAKGFVDLVSGRPRAAIQEYRWALAHGTDASPVISLRLGQAYYEAGDLISARTQLELAMRSGLSVVRQQAALLLDRLQTTPSATEGFTAKPHHE